MAKMPMVSHNLDPATCWNSQLAKTITNIASTESHQEMSSMMIFISPSSTFSMIESCAIQQDGLAVPAHLDATVAAKRDAFWRNETTHVHGGCRGKGGLHLDELHTKSTLEVLIAIHNRITMILKWFSYCSVKFRRYVDGKEIFSHSP